MRMFENNAIKHIKRLFEVRFSDELTSASPLGSDLLFGFFETEEFVESWHKLALDVRAEFFDSQENVGLQATPTPRIFLPNQHGTSFHTDHLYGHGLRAMTIWVPLHGVSKKNSFAFLKPGGVNEFSEKSLFVEYNVHLEHQLLAASENVDVGDNECVVFSSSEIHGSPKNESDITRYSFDFRMAIVDDETSNKDLSQYSIIRDNKWASPLDELKDRKFLKYVCGTKRFSTRSQHLLINSVADALKINIVAQEAELERFGHPIFDQYHDKLLDAKEFDTLIVASREVLDQDKIDHYAMSDVGIFIASEEQFLNRRMPWSRCTHNRHLRARDSVTRLICA